MKQNENRNEAEIDSEAAKAPETQTGKSEEGGGRNKTLIIVSSVIFLFVVAISAGLKYQSYRTAAETASIQAEIADFDSKIAQLKADPLVAAADLMTRNRESVESSVKRSMAHEYVNALEKLHGEYDVDFNGFSYSNGKVSTMVSSDRIAPGVDPIDRVIKFVGDYRSGSGSASGSILSLGEIKLVTGDDGKRTFNAEFKIK